MSDLDNFCLKAFNKSKVKRIDSMFHDCSYLYTVNVTSFDTRNFVDMSYMFYKVSFLSLLNVTNYIKDNAESINLMLFRCKLIGEKHLKLEISDLCS